MKFNLWIQKKLSTLDLPSLIIFQQFSSSFFWITCWMLDYPLKFILQFTCNFCNFIAKANFHKWKKGGEYIFHCVCFINSYEEKLEACMIPKWRNILNFFVVGQYKQKGAERIWFGIMCIILMFYVDMCLNG